MSWYIGLDIGTTNIKANAFCLEKDTHAVVASAPTPRYYPSASDENYELDADALFDTAVQVLQQLLTAIPANEVRGIGVSSLGESGILVDSRMQPLGKSISWFDPRSQQQSLNLDKALGREHIYQITGQLSSSKFGITKLLWSKEHQSEIFARAVRWMAINDYILYRLSGEVACDYSIAARTMAFDIRRLGWSQEILSAAELSPSFFSEPVPGGTAVGKLHPDLANALGLPDDVIISTGGHDHGCAAVGSGSIQEGSVLDSMGTAEVFMMAVDKPAATRALYEAQVNIYPHCSGTLYRALTSMQACGASINWFLDGIGKPIADAANALGENPAAYLSKIAAEASDDSGFHYFPFLRGSQSQPNGCGVFLGFRDQHGLPSFAKALLDGLCCEFNWQLKSAAEQFGVQPQRIVAVGGPSRSDYFVQRKANFTGICVQRPSSQEAASFGAALLAAVAKGEISFEDTTQLAQRSGCTSFEPQVNPLLNQLSANYNRRRGFIEDCYR